jgi:hypothetical protein
MEKKNVVRLLYFGLLLYAHFYLSYNYNAGWWHSMLGFFVISGLGFLIWPTSFLRVAGMRMPFTGLVLVIALTALLTFVSWLISVNIANSAGVTIKVAAFESYVHCFFYIASEELITGAVMLHLFRSRLRLSPLVASAMLALLLALAHLLLYKWYFKDKGFLETGTLLTLLFTVFVKNNLIVKAGHIGYAWALHFGWMAVMYGSLHVYNENGRVLNDLEKFNLYLGSPWVVVISFLLAGLSLLLYFPRVVRRSA